MTKEEAIKYLQQLYPNGGHCLLDEQRIEAISMAVKALQEEPISEDLEEAIEDAMPDANWYIEENNDTTGEDAYNSIQMGNMFKAGAKWQKEKMMAKAVDGEVTYGKSLAIPSLGWVLDKEELNFGDKVKLIFIKGD